ncbi:hypothetical protein Tco_1183259 [Tanacetum coccineum]
MENANPFVPVPPNRLHCNTTKCPLEQLLDDFINPLDILEIDEFEFDDESVDTPLVSPFLDSGDDSDASEVLNELDEYRNAINFYPIGNDLAFYCMIDSLASSEETGEVNPFLPAQVSHGILSDLPHPEIQRRSDGLTLNKLANFHDVSSLRLEATLRDDEGRLEAREDSVICGLKAENDRLVRVSDKGISPKPEDMNDYELDVEEIYDKVIDDFYRVEFPYLDLLAYYLKKSLGLLKSLKPPPLPIREASGVGSSSSPFI